ncbi:MAG TPA: amidohydrolase family protein [Pseudonocardiaceae bacterium]|jgi:predicted TIM-barrel fold metal-dependent hydrolase
MADTTRAAQRLITSGTMHRHPGLRVILPHGGGYLPYIGTRLARFYYDTAQPTSPSATPSLLGYAGPDRILYGTDYALAPAWIFGVVNELIDADPVLTDPLRAAMYRENALRLLPSVAARLG